MNMTGTINRNGYNTVMLFRKCGYAPYTNRQEKSSFVRRVGFGEFPRFHLYILSEDESLIRYSIHIDQNAPVYTGARAHAGDYDSQTVADEIQRIFQF